ncbi:FG-GAP-like repeat-containing protein [Streptomyces sp. PmtG]
MRLHTTALLTTTLTAAALLPVALPASAAAAPAKYADDFNGDGYRDLAVSAPNATVSGKEHAGQVVVFYGSAQGLSPTRKQTVSKASRGIPGAPEKYASFGEGLAAGDLDRDGYADLVVGTPRKDTGSDRDAGDVTVIWGGRSGLTAGATIKPAAVPDRGCAFGEGLAVGDTDGNGAADVTVGSRCGAQFFYGPFTRAGAPLKKERDRQLGTTRGAVVGNVDGDAVRGAHHAARPVQRRSTRARIRRQLGRRAVQAHRVAACRRHGRSRR